MCFSLWNWGWIQQTELEHLDLYLDKHMVPSTGDGGHRLIAGLNVVLKFLSIAPPSVEWITLSTPCHCETRKENIEIEMNSSPAIAPRPSLWEPLWCQQCHKLKGTCVVTNFGQVHHNDCVKGRAMCSVWKRFFFIFKKQFFSVRKWKHN